MSKHRRYFIHTTGLNITCVENETLVTCNEKLRTKIKHTFIGFSNYIFMLQQNAIMINSHTIPQTTQQHTTSKYVNASLNASRKSRKLLCLLRIYFAFFIIYHINFIAHILFEYVMTTMCKAACCIRK